jgi:rsbT antagonist protein RsbS
MSVPILKQGPLLIASLQSSLSDSEWEHFRDDLLNRAGKPGIKAGVIELTSMDVIDSYAARTLRELVQMLRLRGTRAVIVGIQPEVAFSMAQLGLKLDGVATALDLEVALELLSYSPLGSGLPGSGGNGGGGPHA